MTHNRNSESYTDTEAVAEAQARADDIQEVKFIRPNQGEMVEAFGERTRIILTCQDTQGQLVLSEVETPSGWGPPLHVHTQADKVFIIQSGRYEFQVGNQCLEAEPGTVIYCPCNVPHTFCVVSEIPGRLLMLTRPGGWEHFLKRCAREFATGAPNLATIIDIGNEHNIYFLPSDKG